MNRILHALLSFLCILLASFPVQGEEVNCAGGSSISGIEGFGISISLNELADMILFHSTLVENFSKTTLLEKGLEFSKELSPSSAVVSICITSAECLTDDGISGYATSMNVDLSRAALCYLKDLEFHAISSIVWEEDRLILSGTEEARELILSVLEDVLDMLAADLRKADPELYDITSLDM